MTMLTDQHQKFGIFASEAPHYWNAGLQVMPLHERAKIPVLSKWSAWSREAQTFEQRSAWMQEYAFNNIGLVCGEFSSIAMIDVDTDDPRVATVLRDLIPDWPWVRVGKKGFMIAVFSPKELGNHSFKLDAEGFNGHIIEFMYNGNQVVLPPSIHPETLQPYTANANLYDVLPRVPVLFPNFKEILIEALKEQGIKVTSATGKGVRLNTSAFVAKGARDNSMTAHAGIITRAILRGERTVQQGIDEMKHWCETYLQVDPTDPPDIQKGIQQVFGFLEKEIHSPDSNRSLPAGWDADISPEALQVIHSMFTKDDMEWTVEEVKSYIYTQLREASQAGEVGVDTDKLYEYIVRRVAKSPSIVNNESRLAHTTRYIADTLHRVGVTASVVKRDVTKAQFGKIEGKNHTEIAQAVIEHYEQFGALRLENDQFWQWKGSSWVMIDQNDLARYLAEEFGAAAAAKKQSDHAGILRLIRSLLPKGLKTNPEYGINFSNGYLTTALKLEPHKPEYGANYTLPYPYVGPGDPEYKEPKLFLGLLEKCWVGESDYEDKVQALREAICATLFGIAPILQRAFLLKGIARSGKSTVREIVERLLPEEMISRVPPENWHDRFMPVMMANKMMNACGETSNTQYIDGKYFKEIVEGAPQAGQYKGRDIFHFKPVCAQWISGNHLPRTKDTSDGFNRRFLIFTFNRKIPAHDRVLDYATVVADEEKHLIASWAAAAITRLLGPDGRNDYTMPSSSVHAVEVMAENNNSLRFFLNQSKKILLDIRGVSAADEEDPNRASSHISAGLVYSEYINFCVERNAKPVGWREFELLIEELGSDFGISTKPAPAENGTLENQWYGITLVGHGVERLKPSSGKRSNTSTPRVLETVNPMTG